MLQELLTFIDRMCGAWLDWRMTQLIAHDLELSKFEFKKAEFTPDGFTTTGISPMAAIIANEAAQMLNRVGAENFITFDMMPRLDRGLRPVRMTVQWADRLSPAAKAEKLTQELQTAQARIAELETPTTTEERAVAILRKIVAMVNAVGEEGEPFGLAWDFGDNQLTVCFPDGSHTHVGAPLPEGTFDVLVEQLFEQVVNGCGLSRVKA